MDATGTGTVTRLLHDWQAGDETALRELLSRVYEDLHHLAARRLRGERRASGVRTTSLLHDAYLRLAAQRAADWKSRGHFFAVAATVLRRTLVDRVRRRGSLKRGGGALELPLECALEAPVGTRADLLALDDALASLAEIHPELARMVDMRFIAGMTNCEIAEALGVSTPTVTRRIRTARAWLYRRLTAGGKHGL